MGGFAVVGVSVKLNGVSVTRNISVVSAEVGSSLGGFGVAVEISIAASTGVAVEWTLPQAVEYNIIAAIARIAIPLVRRQMQLI